MKIFTELISGFNEVKLQQFFEKEIKNRRGCFNNKIAFYEAQAANGNVDALFTIAILYISGKGVRKNDYKAFKNF